MIVECNGLPGCGKTSLVEEISKILLSKGVLLRVVSVSTFRHGEKKSSKVKRALMMLSPETIWISLKARHLNDSFSFLSFKERLITLMYLHYLLKEFSETEKMVLSDEGIIQSLATISCFTDVETRDIKAAKELIRSEDVIELNCELSMDESIERIMARHRHDSAIDQMQGKVLADYLFQYNTRLKSLRQICRNSVSLDMRKSVGELAEEITKVLEGNT